MRSTRSRSAERFPGLRATVLGEAEIRERGDGRVRRGGPGIGAARALIRLEYDGAQVPARRGSALVGKAVTFDTGGISLKPAAKMLEMKFDMAGGAAVIEAIAAIAELDLPVRVLGVVGATENMPSGSAVKPGDIVTAVDGTTIEVNNTDAEGRLVLADCLSYALREGADRIVDIATLTGGIVVALGSVYAGLMSNDDDWASARADVGAAHGRAGLADAAAPRVRRDGQGPLRPDHERDRAPRGDSAITGAEFLHHFAGEVPWAHLDIAGTGYDVRKPYFPTRAPPGSACG